MAKKKGILDDLMDALGDSGGEIISDLIEEVTGTKVSASKGDDLLESLLGGGSSLLEGLGDIMSDLTGVGAVNTKASEVARMDGKVKSSAAKKKTFTSSAAKKTGAKKTTSAATKTTVRTSAAAKKPMSSAAKKKSLIKEP